jgi:hypothetical protein
MIPSTYLEALTTSSHFSTFQFHAIANTKVGQKTNDIDEKNVDAAYTRANISYGLKYVH